MKNLNKFSILLLGLIICNSIFAQDDIINNANLAEAELSVAINPIDSNNIVIATMYGFFQSNGHYINIYYTNDFGESWQLSNFHGEYEGDNGAGDPVLSFDDQGNAYLANISIQMTDSFPNYATILSKSEDGGATWSLASIVANNSDKPWLAIDQFEDSPHYGNFYIPVIKEVPELFILDPNFQIVHQLEIIPNGDHHIPSVAVKKNGEVFISTVDVENDPNEVFIHQYSDGGEVLVHSTFVTSFPNYIFNAPDISDRFQPTAYIAMDNTGGLYDGRIYLSYTASENGNSPYFDVFITYSDDNGNTWSAPKVVHNDQTENEQQFYSSLYVNSSGILILDWYDRRNFDNSNLVTDFYMGISYDGGNTFSEVQLNSSSMDFEYMIPTNSGFGIGEYHQLVATGSTAISFWADGRTNDGDINIYMAKVDINSPVTGVEELTLLSDKIAISKIYPQPVSDVINLDLELMEKNYLKLEIIDLNGRELWADSWKNYNIGQHKIKIHCGVSPGIYLLQIKSNKGYFKTMKFVKI